MSRVDTFPDPFLTTWPTSGRVIILDLEYTSWEGSIHRNWAEKWEFREIVQIGAVRLTVKRHEFIKEETFERIVKPVRNPQLSDHFSNLTGITNNLVSEQGNYFNDAFTDFVQFVTNSSQIWSANLPDCCMTALWLCTQVLPHGQNTILITVGFVFVVE